MIQTAPTVTYRIVRHDGTSEDIHSAGMLPDPDRYVKLLEPAHPRRASGPASRPGDPASTARKPRAR
jgi:translation elongation factor EF-4